MRYLIDGYNLLFRIAQTDEDLQVQREKLIRSLDSRFAVARLKGILVFDAHLQPGVGAIAYAKHFDIHYTAHTQTADEAILELLKGLKATEWTVVTSDKRLAWKVRRSHFRTESIEQFLVWLKKRVHTKQHKREKAPVREILPLPKKKIPALQAHPEECLDYYLEMFQRDLPPEKPLSEKKALQKPKVPKKKSTTEWKEAKGDPKLSDFERWLNAFQNKSP